MSKDEIKQQAEAMGFDYYEKNGIIDIDGPQGSNLGGTFTGWTAGKDAQNWLNMHQSLQDTDTGKECK